MSHEWTRFESLYNGPVLAGEAAKHWDSTMLTNEQSFVQPLYTKPSGLEWTEIWLGAKVHMGAGANIYNKNDRIIYGRSQLGRVYGSGVLSSRK